MLLLAPGCSPSSREATEPLGSLAGAVSWLSGWPKAAHLVAFNTQAPQHDQTYAVWWLTSLVSSEHRRLREELDAVQALSRRIAAVKFTAVEFAARGQVGVRPPPPEEAALRRASRALRTVRSRRTGDDVKGDT